MQCTHFALQQASNFQDYADSGLAAGSAGYAGMEQLHAQKSLHLSMLHESAMTTACQTLHMRVQI